MVSQRQVGQDVPSFSDGLRSALRENPDIIFVGERDTETASLALSAAETGHLVFSTLHTDDAKGLLVESLTCSHLNRLKVYVYSYHLVFLMF